MKKYQNGVSNKFKLIFLHVRGILKSVEKEAGCFKAFWRMTRISKTKLYELGIWKPKNFVQKDAKKVTPLVPFQTALPNSLKELTPPGREPSAI